MDGREFVTGLHKYASDITRPGMLHGKVLRPASFDATLTSVDTKEAEAMPGVVVVHDGNFVGVAAPNAQSAERGLKAIRAEWNEKPQISNAELFDTLKKTGSGGGGGGGRGGGGSSGSIEQGLAEADVKLQQTYTVAYIAHVPMEPRAAVAEWKDGKLTFGRERSGHSACVATWRRPSEFQKNASASSCPTPAAALAGSTAGKQRSKQRDWQRLQANR